MFVEDGGSKDHVATFSQRRHSATPEGTREAAVSPLAPIGKHFLGSGEHVPGVVVGASYAVPSALPRSGSNLYDDCTAIPSGEHNELNIMKDSSASFTGTRGQHTPNHTESRDTATAITSTTSTKPKTSSSSQSIVAAADNRVRGKQPRDDAAQVPGMEPHNAPHGRVPTVDILGAAPPYVTTALGRDFGIAVGAEATSVARIGTAVRSVHRRSSTGAIKERYGYGRRRGSRPAIIEEPRAGDVGAGGGDEEEMGQVLRSSLSFCTVPLPKEDGAAERLASFDNMVRAVVFNGDCQGNY